MRMSFIDIGIRISSAQICVKISAVFGHAKDTVNVK